MKTKTIQMQGYRGPGTTHMPLGDFLLPADSEEGAHHAELGVRCVVESGEYRHPRQPFERGLRTILDVGSHLGSFSLWAAKCWWPGQIARIDAFDPNEQAITIARQNTAGLPIHFHHAAVTVQPTARLVLTDTLGRDNWGGARTHGIVDEGVDVPVLHPRELPAADIAKWDAEGVEVEMAEHYAHWATLRILMFEWHHVPHRQQLIDICKGRGMSLLHDDQGPDGGQGQQVWGRP